MVVIRFVLEAAVLNVDMLLGVIAKGAAAIEDIIMDPSASWGTCSRH